MDLTDLKHFGIDLSFPYKKHYENYIGGRWVAPVDKQYFDNLSPITGQVFCEVPRSGASDVELALDAAHAARKAWSETSVAERAGVLLRMADRMEQNLRLLATAETIDNGKPIRETLNADLPLAIDHLRYFAGCIRAQEGGISEIDKTTVAYHFQEPMGVVGQIIPWNFPLLMAAWKLGPALAAGNCVVLKPAEQTPASILVLMELVGDLLPPGVLNIVNGFGKEAGQALASSKRISKIAFTGSTPTGKHILHAAADNLIPSTVELGGKSPNIFFASVMDQDVAFFDKTLEGFSMFALNQGEICTCPSRILVQESIYERFIERAVKRVEAMKTGHRPRPRFLCQTHPALRDQQHACLSGGDLWPGRISDDLQGRGRGHRHRQRHLLWPGRWRLVARRFAGLPRRAPDTGRAGLDELLQPLSGPRSLWRLQTIRHRARNSQNGTERLPADQMPAGKLQPERTGFLLTPRYVRLHMPALEHPARAGTSP
jgi:hypothetical protein